MLFHLRQNENCKSFNEDEHSDIFVWEFRVWLSSASSITTLCWCEIQHKAQHLIAGCHIVMCIFIKAKKNYRATRETKNLHSHHSPQVEKKATAEKSRKKKTHQQRQKDKWNGSKIVKLNNYEKKLTTHHKRVSITHCIHILFPLFLILQRASVPCHSYSFISLSLLFIDCTRCTNGTTDGKSNVNVCKCTRAMKREIELLATTADKLWANVHKIENHISRVCWFLSIAFTTTVDVKHFSVRGKLKPRLTP